MSERSISMVSRRFFVPLCSLLVLLHVSGCASYQVQTARDLRVASEMSEPQQIHVFLWGLFKTGHAYGEGRKAPDGTRIGFEVAKVEVFVLPTILTFGIWMPGQATYIYAESPTTGGLDPRGK
jgi:hypothetical protein